MNERFSLSSLGNNSLRWLIVEDALRDQTGHWFECLGAFRRGLLELGDKVTILADHEAQPLIRESLQVLPVLPASIWHRMNASNGAGRLARYFRVPAHAWQTVQAMRRYLAYSPQHDVIFVPTVWIHHLLAWTWLIKWNLRCKHIRVLLFFILAPVTFDPVVGRAVWTRSPTARLFRRLLRALASEVVAGRVLLGVETRPMRDALTALTGLPFTYFPQPLSLMPAEYPNSAPGESLVMGSYGGVRPDKGSDILYRAVAEFSRRNPDSRVQFMLHCREGFATESPLARRQSARHLVDRLPRVGKVCQATARDSCHVTPVSDRRLPLPRFACRG